MDGYEYPQGIGLQYDPVVERIQCSELLPSILLKDEV